MADLDQDAAQQVAMGLTDEARRHLAVWLDVIDVSSVEQAFADATVGLGGIDIVVNVAGGDTDHGGFEETKDDGWHPGEYRRASHHQDPELGPTRGRSGSPSPSLPARTRRRA